jgi:hypothetical protein
VSTYVAPKTIIDTFVERLRAHTGEPLASCTFRKGPQVALNMGTAPCACIVALQRLEGGEESRGSGNNWMHTWRIAVWLGTPDSETSPEAAEDRRLDLIDEFGEFMMHGRTLFGGAKVGRIASCDLGMGQYFAADDTVYRYAECTVEYQTIRSASA